MLRVLKTLFFEALAFAILILFPLALYFYS